jgi:transcription initiation factor TFIIIB Brf1 subunit/transcription initiation factor TFIIB
VVVGLGEDVTDVVQVVLGGVVEEGLVNGRDREAVVGDALEFAAAVDADTVN